MTIRNKGSVLGPKLWNLVMDGLFNTLQEHQYAYPIAYVDDLVVIIVGNSRRELEQRVTDVIRIIERWTARQKLQPWMKIIGYETAISDICPWQQRTK